MVTRISLGAREGAQETWTPKLAGARLVEAVRWSGYLARVGPSGIKGSMPAYTATLDDHLDEGWGLPEVADLDEADAKRLVIQATPAQITAYEAALSWPATYLYPDHISSAKLVWLWAACKAFRHPFEDAITRRYSRVVDGKREYGMSRATAFRLRDRGLSLISQGLDRDGVPL